MSSRYISLVCVTYPPLKELSLIFDQQKRKLCNCIKDCKVDNCLLNNLLILFVNFVTDLLQELLLQPVHNRVREREKGKRGRERQLERESASVRV